MFIDVFGWLPLRFLNIRRCGYIKKYSIQRERNCLIVNFGVYLISLFWSNI